MNTFEESKKYFKTPLQEFIFFDKYSRYRYDLGRRETWIETVDRAVDYLKELSQNKLSDFEYNRIRTFILDMKVMPSMRLLAMAGDAAKRQPLSIFNCSFLGIDSIEAFEEILLLGMAGVGVGYSVEHKYIDKLPYVPKVIKPVDEIIHHIEDTTEGWGSAVHNHISNLYNGCKINFDYSLIRLEGTPLKTKGGRASGPNELRKAIDFITNTFENAKGRKLSSVECHDIACMLGQAVISGGVRRTALISLFDSNDIDMRECKTGDFPSYRWFANNSEVLLDEPTREHFDDIIDSIYESQRGEPGLYSLYNARRMAPDRRDGSRIDGLNPCLSGDTQVYVADGRDNITIKELAEEGKDVSVFCFDDTGKVVIRTMRNPRITGYDVDIYKITLDDGSTIKATHNHKFLTRSGEYKQVKDLQTDESLQITTKYKASIKELFPKANSNSSDYWWINTGLRKTEAEHRIIASNHYNTKIQTGFVVHHKDYNSMNNSPNNLEIISKKDHDVLHSKNMIGDKNPMVRAKTEWSDQRWEEYKNKHRYNSGEGRNPNYSGFSNDDILEHAINLTKSLGYRFSTKDWISYAKPYGLPLKFSKWRENHFNGITGLSKQASVIVFGIDSNEYLHIDKDPRILRRLNNLILDGYDCFIDSDLNDILFNKNCEYCNKHFTTTKKEIAFCSNRCGNLRSNRNLDKFKKSIKLSYDIKKESTRQKQVELYLKLKAQLNRTPFKKEWQDYCDDNNLSKEISRKSSPFRTWDSLKDAVSNYNHKIVSIEYVGKETVYNGTVDEFHNFFVGGFESKTASGKDKIQYLNNLQCGEVFLRNMQTCNLSSVICREDDTFESLTEKIVVASIIGTIQSMADYFPGMRPEWSQNQKEERLLGVDLNGQMDCNILRNDIFGHIYEHLKETAVAANKKYAAILGINQSAAVSCVKPNGNSSQLVNSSSGLHPRYSKYYIRNVRVNVTSPVYKVLFESGVPIVPENGQDWSTIQTAVASFPIKSPEGATIRNDLSAIDMANFWKRNKLNYTEMNPSVTIQYRDYEKDELREWLWANRNIIGGITILPFSDANYSNMPYVEISEDEYINAVMKFPDIDWTRIEYWEQEDLTTSAQELACLGGGCLI